MKLDKQDRQLLSFLQIDARTSVERMADEIGLSAMSVHRRLKRLRDEKVIKNEIAIIEPNAVDQAMTFLVSVELERDNSQYLPRFKSKVNEEPHVQQCYYITGEFDFILVVTARDMSDFEDFTQRLFFNDSNVRRYKTSVVMDKTKVGLTLAID